MSSRHQSVKLQVVDPNLRRHQLVQQGTEEVGKALEFLLYYVNASITERQGLSDLNLFRLVGFRQ